MHGFLLLTFVPEHVGIDLDTGVAADAPATSRKDLKEQLEASKLSSFRPANNVSHDGHVMVVNDRLVGSVAIQIDPATDTFRCESRFAELKPERVQIRFWISNQGPERWLRYGTWFDATREARDVSALIAPSPIGDDPRRAEIQVFAPDIATARATLFDILRGKIRIEDPFVV